MARPWFMAVVAVHGTHWLAAGRRWLAAYAGHVQGSRPWSERAEIAQSSRYSTVQPEHERTAKRQQLTGAEEQHREPSAVALELRMADGRFN